MEIPNHFSSDFMSYPHSQHIDAIMILWLPGDSEFTVQDGSAQDGFEIHVFALRTDLKLRLEYRFGTRIRRFLPGWEPLPPKKVKRKEDVSKSTKNYEKDKRASSFWDGPVRCKLVLLSSIRFVYNPDDLSLKPLGAFGTIMSEENFRERKPSENHGTRWKWAHQFQNSRRLYDFPKSLKSLENCCEKKISKLLGNLPSKQIIYLNIMLGAPDSWSV